MVNLKDYGLADLYVVYWHGVPVAEVGNPKIDSKNLEANYTVTKQKLRVP